MDETSVGEASIIGSFDMAKRLIDQEHSALKLMTRAMHLTIPPFYFDKIQKAVAIYLNKEIEFYSHELSGVPVAFNKKKVKLLSQNGVIMPGQPKIHCEFEAEFIVFAPSIGDILKGVVHKLNQKTFGCLVHGYFYVSVRYEYNTSVELGDKVDLKVTKLDEDGQGYMSIFGECLNKSGGKSHVEIDSGIDDGEQIVNPLPPQSLFHSNENIDLGESCFPSFDATAPEVLPEEPEAMEEEVSPEEFSEVITEKIISENESENQSDSNKQPKASIDPPLRVKIKQEPPEKPRSSNKKEKKKEKKSKKSKKDEEKDELTLLQEQLSKMQQKEQKRKEKKRLRKLRKSELDVSQADVDKTQESSKLSTSLTDIVNTQISLEDQKLLTSDPSFVHDLKSFSISNATPSTDATTLVESSEKKNKSKKSKKDKSEKKSTKKKGKRPADAESSFVSSDEPAKKRLKN